ncbi:hypothetical protein DPMN_184240 [Dreissena polymorpha]|uniref:Uncharacterized protein n=1 Tax=Dreissena polymorpha TaxID=45954 RepID=A0A9D4DJM1_DREPO|nr:hypothetical protein DPMN_184240 [Dreissena polymorpha]
MHWPRKIALGWSLIAVSGFATYYLTVKAVQNKKRDDMKERRKIRKEIEQQDRELEALRRELDEATIPQK